MSDRARPAPVPAPVIGVIMGSASDWQTMQHADETLRGFSLPYECRVVSAHRTPERMRDYARQAAGRGIEVIVAAAGGAAHLPGMVAAYTTLPVLGVPVQSHALHGVDSLLSIVQDAGRRAGRHPGHRACRRGQRCPAGAVHCGAEPPAPARRAGGVPRPADRGGGGCRPAGGRLLMTGRRCWLP